MTGAVSGLSLGAEKRSKEQPYKLIPANPYKVSGADSLRY